MKITVLALLVYLINFTLAAPPSLTNSDLLSRDDSTPKASYNDLEKRRGGGGGRGSSSGGSGSGGSGGRAISSYSFSSASNTGGRTISGSGSPPAYGNRYTGGATVPYTSGGKSPTRGISPAFLPIAAVGFFPGLWLFPVWAYPYGYGYHWYAGGRNHTSNVTCLCQQYSVCGCDPDDNSTFVQQMVTNGTGVEPVNTTTVRTVDFGNGTVTSYINGTLDNGTTAPGGTEPSNESQISAAARLVIEFGGYWLMIATVIAAVTMV